MRTKWDKFYKGYSIKTLHYWCREDDIIKHSELEKQYNKNDELNKIFDPDYRKIDTQNNNIVLPKLEFSKRYLLDQDKLLNDNDDVFVNGFNQALHSEDIKTIAIRSPYDTGKTQLLKQIVPNYKRILWISYRISLTNDIKGNFESLGFKSYLDKHSLGNDKLIIQIESLAKLRTEMFIDNDTEEIPYYDLVIIDEIEGVLNQFNSSKTMNGKACQLYNYLEKIINNSCKLVVLDGDIFDRTLDYIKPFGGLSFFVNNIKINQKHINVIKNKVEYYNDIYKSLDNDKKIVIATQSSKEDKFMKYHLTNKYPHLNIRCYHASTDDKVKMMLENVVVAFDVLDVLIYTPTIEAGVSYDMSRFYKLYGVVCYGSNSQRAFFQMLSRVRKFESDEILILNDGLKYNDIEPYSFDSIKNNVFNSNKSDDSLFITSVTKNSDNKPIQKKALTAYGKNYIHNLLEDKNKHKSLFLKLFKIIAESKGHTITINDEKPKMTNKNKVYLAKMKTEKKDLANKDVKEADDIDDTVFNMLQVDKKKNNLSEIDKYKLEKYYYKKLLGVDVLDDNIINKFCKNSKISNFINLVDVGNYKIQYDDAKFYNKQKLDIVLSVINQLGYNNIFDNKLLSDKELNERFEYIKINNELFKNDNIKFLFNMLLIKRNKLDSNKAVLGLINSVLEPYSVKIQSVQKKVNGKHQYFYKLELLDNIDEIIYYKINRGFKLVDDQNIFKYDVSQREPKYNHLISDKIEVDEELDEYSLLDIEFQLGLLDIEVQPSKLHSVINTCRLCKGLSDNKPFYNDTICNNCASVHYRVEVSESKII